MTRKTCKAKAKVDFGKYFDNGKMMVIKCCLFAPHPEHYHYSPSFRLTLGGHTAKVKGWRSWVAKKGEPNYKAS